MGETGALTRGENALNSLPALTQPQHHAGKDRIVPQLIFFAVLGVVAYVGYRSFLREAERVTAKARRAEAEQRAGSNGTLVKDPATGEYHLLKD